jgi:hypothetical protein
MNLINIIDIWNKYKLHYEIKKAIPMAVNQFILDFEDKSFRTTDKILEQLKYANWSAEKPIPEICGNMKDNWSQHPKIYQWGLNLNCQCWQEIKLEKNETIAPLYFGFDQKKTQRPKKIQDWFNNKSYEDFSYPVAKKLRKINNNLDAWSGRFLFLIHPDHFDPEVHSMNILIEVTKGVEKLLQKSIKPILDGHCGNKEYIKYLESKEKCILG